MTIAQTPMFPRHQNARPAPEAGGCSRPDLRQTPAQRLAHPVANSIRLRDFSRDHPTVVIRGWALQLSELDVDG